jgi:hypothetical protein
VKVSPAGAAERNDKVIAAKIIYTLTNPMQRGLQTNAGLKVEMCCIHCCCRTNWLHYHQFQHGSIPFFAPATIR